MMATVEQLLAGLGSGIESTAGSVVVTPELQEHEYRSGR